MCGVWNGAGRVGRQARMLGIGAVAVVSALVLASGAMAAGKTVNVATPFSSGPPSVVVDGSGNAVIAWANTKDLNGAFNFVQYCVLPLGQTTCSHSGSLAPADSAQFIDGVHVLSVGNTLVLLADVFGTAGDNATDYEPVQEWQSTDGGATFTQETSGLSVTSGILSADTVPVNAVVLPGTGQLGFGWETAGPSPPTFNAFPLASPPECSRATCPTGFATLEPASNPDQIGNPSGEFASATTGANSGVLGIFATINTNGPLGCAQTFGTAYTFGDGNQSPANDYNVSPGQPNTAWRVPVTQADCNVENPAVGGGPSGFGVLETDDGTSSTVYHRFDEATEKFDTPLVTVTKAKELDPALSQDGAGGIYGSYLSGGPGGPVALSYSADAGKSWTSGTLNPDKSGGAGSVTSAVNSAGQGWAAWIDNGSVFAQSFRASDAITPAAVSGSGSSNGATVTLTLSCASVPCTITVTITSSGAVASAASKKHKAKTITLAKGKVTLHKTGRRKLTLHLSKAGQRFLHSKKGHVKVALRLSELVQRHTVLTKRTLTVKVTHPKHKK
jgi:hypothetical protein